MAVALVVAARWAVTSAAGVNFQVHVKPLTLLGELATLSEVQSDPSIVERLGAGLVVDGVPYPEHFGRLEEFRPTFIRMERQRPLSRLKAEIVERLRAHP